MARALVFVALSVWLASADTVSAESLSERWLDLWTRCRVAIEEVRPLDTESLMPFELPPNRRYQAQRGWWRDGDRFIVHEFEWRRGQGVRRGCDVVLAPEAQPLSEAEEAVLLRTFLVERAKLIGEQTHQVRNPDPMFPVVPLGVGPTVKNVNRCQVVSAIFIDPTSDFFTSGTGEQVFGDCVGLSFLNREEKPIGNPIRWQGEFLEGLRDWGRTAH